MAFEFDPIKDEINRRRHEGLSLTRAADLEPIIVLRDDRKDYGETRYRAFGYIDGEPHCLAFTYRGENVRPISLRRAHAKEMKRYVPKE